MNPLSTLYLLAFPIGLIGVVQVVFSLLAHVTFRDGMESQFFVPGMFMVIASIVLLSLSRHFDVSRIGYRDALLYAVVTWLVTGTLGAIPVVTITGVSAVDGLFESFSAFTTTGATILDGLDGMPKSFLLYRQFLQWLGGLGVVIFVVAVLPMLNVGGMKLLRAETPGPVKDDKLSPRIADTAHYLWGVYLVLTVLCAAAYYFAGMSLFDAICHSFTTVSTGGFSTHDASMGYFDSPKILLVSDLFMLLGAINFALHHRVWRRSRLSSYLRDEETRTFLLLVLLLSAIIAALLQQQGIYPDVLTAGNLALFHLVSFITSTGYGAGVFIEWPLVVIFLLIFSGYLGGCAGSTAGGNKIIRGIIMVKMIRHELRRLLHPKGVFTVKYHSRPVEISVISASMAFITLGTITSLAITLLLMATGLDFLSAFSATAACLNVLGPGFGELGANFQPVSDAGTVLLSFAMILGRLEYFTVLALLLPSLWRY
jgi:trk system potassium uptake protein TrkH